MAEENEKPEAEEDAKLLGRILKRPRLVVPEEEGPPPSEGEG